MNAGKLRDVTQTSLPSISGSSVPPTEPGFDDRNVITPFAQILANLHNVRHHLMRILELSNSSAEDKKEKGEKTQVDVLDEIYEITSDTLADYEKCLEEVEAIPIQQSISSMTSLKFKRLLDKELNHFSESKSGTQISRYIADTFTENDESGGEEASCSFKNLSSASSSEQLKASRGVSGSAGKLCQSAPAPLAAPTPSTTVNVFGAKKSSASLNLTSKLCKLYQLRKPHYRSISQKTFPALRGSAPGGAGAAKFSMAGGAEFYGVDTDKRRQLDECMRDLNSWGLDVFSLHTWTKGRPLTCILYTVFKERNLLQHFRINEQVLLKYCNHLESNYNNSNPYHNAIHAADVTQGMHFLLSSKMFQEMYNELEIFAALFASAIHDVNHPGVTNQFLVNTASDLAIMYNDESVLEHHHLAIAFKLLQHQHCNFLADWNKKQFTTFRRTVIEMVLATDMAKHMTLLGYLKTVVETKKLTTDGYLAFDAHKEKTELLKCMIHLADLSNPTKPIDLYRQWTERICEEFWRQGDQERKLGLEISPLCDRKNASLEKSQIGFIDYVVLPLWETWAELVYPSAQFVLDNLEFNRRWYFERIPLEEDNENCDSSSNRSNASKK